MSYKFWNLKKTSNIMLANVLPEHSETCVYIEEDSIDKVDIDFKNISKQRELGVSYCDSLNPFLKKQNTKNICQMNDILTFLSFCDCCDRHQKNKPVFFAPWVELPFLDTQHFECMCDCRNLARLICRQHKDYSDRVQNMNFD